MLRYEFVQMCTVFMQPQFYFVMDSIYGAGQGSINNILYIWSGECVCDVLNHFLIIFYL